MGTGSTGPAVTAKEFRQADSDHFPPCLDFHRKSKFSSGTCAAHRLRPQKLFANRDVNDHFYDPPRWAQFLRKCSRKLERECSKSLTRFSHSYRGFALARLQFIMIETAFCTCSLSNLSEQAAKEFSAVSVCSVRDRSRAKRVRNVTNSSKEFS